MIDVIARRTTAMLAETGVRPFQQYAPQEDDPLLRWRVSRDIWDQLVEFTLAAAIRGDRPAWVSATEDRLWGYPIEGDPTLPPNSIILERTACPLPVWDGPYRMACGRRVVDGLCGRHGRVTTPVTVN